jgi:hypothetical protein
MHEEIINLLRKGTGISSEELAREFFKMKNPVPVLSHRMIESVLGKDRRCYFGDDGLWHAAAVTFAEEAQRAAQDLKALPWLVVHVLVAPPIHENKIYHVSVWSPFPAPAELYQEWFENPESLPYEEQLSLVRTGNPPFNSKSIDDKIDALALLLEKGLPLYLSANHSAALERCAMTRGVSLPDNICLMSQLFHLAAIPVPKPFSVQNCYRSLFERELPSPDARGSGEFLALCAAEIFERCLDAGKATLNDFDTDEDRVSSSFNFSSKAFSFNDIATLPQRPGVYAFQNKDGAYVYIGKAANLRRRVMGYFRESDESPEKLDRLRCEAHSLITHVCGSELESLIYEYRLIKKHHPLINRNVDINERKGTFRPIDDCIVLLPHADENKGMSFWFRRNQKILLKPIDSEFVSSQPLINDLETFFFSTSLPATATDFPEQEIAFRWLKIHGEDCTIVPVSRLKNGAETFTALKSYWKDLNRNTIA